MNFSDEQLERYSRQILLYQVGPEGQEKISNGRILIIGAGGLGAPASLYLAASGIGKLGIADGDVVDISNLQRQVIHFTKDVGRPKVDSAKEKLLEINPDIEVKIYNQKISSENISEIIGDYDFVIDGTDNFSAKFLINDACVMGGKPFSHAGILRFDGQTMTYVPGTPCYRCVFKEPPKQDSVPTCSQAGILGPVAGMLGTIQAQEALKYIIGKGTLLTGRMLVFDSLDMNFRIVPFAKNKSCPVCGDSPSITKLIDHVQPSCDMRKNCC